MAQEIAVVNATLTATGSGTTDFTSSGFGTPTAAVVFVSNANTGSNPQTGAILSIGFWDGTDQASASVTASNAANTATATYRAIRDDYIATVVNTGATATTWLAGYQASAITDGIRLTMAVDNTGAQRYATVVLIKGISAKLLAITPSASTDGTQESASLGFEPKAGLFLSSGVAHNTPNSGSGQTSHAILSFGAATEDGTQRMVGWSSEHNVADTDVTAKFSEDRVAGQIFNGAEDYSVEVTTWGADTITLTSRTAGAGGDTVFALILGGADVVAQVGTITTPTSTGSADVTTTGIDPDAVLLCMSNLASTTLATDGTASGFAVGASNGATHGGYAIVDEDAAAISAAGTIYSGSNAMLMRTSASGTASTLVEGAVSTGTEKFSINYTTASGTARKGWWFVLGTASGGATPINFDGTIATQSAQVGSAFSVDLSSYWSGTATPFAYTVQAGSLPAGLSLNASTGVISGTPTTAGAITGITLRGTDDDAATADSNAFAFDVVPATLWTETETASSQAAGGPPKTAIMGNGRLFFSTARESDNAVLVHRLQGATLTSTVIKTHGGTYDGHNNAGLHVDSSGYVYAVCTPHGSTADLAIYKSDDPYGTAYTLLSSKSPGGAAYYPWLIQYNGLLYLFCNVGANRDIQYCTSSDDGATWGSWTLLFDAPSGGRPYHAISEVDGELVLVTTAYNYQDVTIGLNHAYFARFDGTNWKNAGGSNYTLPLTTGTAEKCFDGAATSPVSSFGFFMQCRKDSSGRFVVQSCAFTSSTARDVYMLRYASGSWSQTEVVHPIAASWQSAPFVDQADPYRFLALADYGGTSQWCLVESTDDGATWKFTRLTSGAMPNYVRANPRLIYGDPIADKWVMYSDEYRIVDWYSDIYLPFSDAGAIEFPILSDLQAVSVTATTVQGTYDYAF